MSTTLDDARVASALERMFDEAEQQWPRLLDRQDEFARLSSAGTRERAEAFSEVYMPVTPTAGRLLYALVRATVPINVVEFGMSFGISAIHLASAVLDNGHGHVITTELSTAKIAAARHTFVETGLDDVITVLEGDALTTLADLDGPIDFVLLDGWKELYLPVIKLLEPQLLPGTLIVADNTDMPESQPYLDYVRDESNGYISVNFLAKDNDSMEISCRATTAECNG